MPHGDPTGRRRVRALTRLAAAVRALVPLTAATALAAGLTACAGPTGLPEGITVLVYQPRTDVLVERIALQVGNDAGAPLEVTAARLEAPGFAEPAVWAGGTATVAAGFALDLRLDLPARVCPDGDPAGTVTLDYRLDGVSGTAVVPVDDPSDLLPRMADTACLRAAVEAIAVIEPAGVLDGPTAGDAEGDLVLVIRPTGGAGSIRLLSVSGTTLISPTDGAGAVDMLRLGIDVGADGPTEVRIPIVPTRCDPHALAEDEVGTRIPVAVAVGGTEGALELVSGADARESIADFWRTACGVG